MNIGELLLNKVFIKKEIISASIVGSYTENKNLEKIGDIDLVIISKKITKKLIKKLVTKIEKLRIKNLKKKIIVNPTFGPVKINSKNILPVHLMIYDIDSHIKHVTDSPFTCYDWERSKFYRGIPLKKIYPVNTLQLRDFFNARRNSKEYLKDLLNNKISIRKYIFFKKKIKLKKKHIKIDPRNRGEFVYHIIKFLTINLYKFLNNKNIKLSNKNFNKLFLKITENNKNILKEYESLKKNKERKKQVYDPNIIDLGKKFIKNYTKFLDNIKNDLIEYNFVRHAKTKKNIKNFFLGSGSNPDIIKSKKKIKKLPDKFDLIITSKLKRAQSSIKYFNGKKIISNHLLNEINYGLAEGMSLNCFKIKYPKIIRNWAKGVDIKFPKGENNNDVKIRALKFLIQLKKIKNKKKILVITHSFFLRVIMSILLNLNINKIYKLKIDYLEKFQINKINNKLIPNIDRNKIKNFFFQIND